MSGDDMYMNPADYPSVFGRDGDPLNSDPYDVFDCRMDRQYNSDEVIDLSGHGVPFFGAVEFGHSNPAWRFKEDELLDEIRSYILDTYEQHYARGGKTQAYEIACERGRGLEFALTCIDKYSGRYGEKGDNPDVHRMDLLKLAHYAILALYDHDLRHKGNSNGN